MQSSIAKATSRGTSTLSSVCLYAAKRSALSVTDGRLRSLDEKESSVEVVREYGQGDSIGELDVITADPRPDTLHAIRDSELVRIPGALFDAISIKHPVTTIQFLRLIASRVRKAVNEKPPLPTSTVVGGSNISRSNLNLSE
jgi:lysophospholipid hydrolase